MQKALIIGTKLFSVNFTILTVYLCLSLPIASASTLSTQQPIRIGSYLTPGLIKEDETGLFNHLNKAIFDEMSETAILSLSSMNRVRQGIKNGRLDAYFPELWENLPADKSQYVVSSPFFYKRVILFTLKDSGLTKTSDLEDKPLGAVQGFSYGTEIKSNPKLKIIFQKNDIININLLLNERLAGVLGGHPGTTLAVKKHSAAEKIHYDINKPIAVLESFYVCKNDPDGVKLCDSISKAIQSLVQKGVLELNSETGFSRFNAFANNKPT